MKKFIAYVIACLSLQAAAQPSKNLTLLSSLQIQGQKASGCWHYNDTTGREYALVGLTDGIVIIDITNPAVPVNLVQLPGAQSLWHEVKVLGDYAYAVSEGQDAGGVMNGVQIIDLRFLPDSFPNKFYTGDSIIISQLVTAHSITAAGNYIYVNGHSIFSLGSGVIILDVSNPWFPKYAGAITNRYCHDSYVRGDRIYTSDIQDGMFSVYDISIPSNPVLLATQSTPGNFNHNTWLSDDGNTLFAADETHNSPLAVYDVSNLSNISLIDTFYNRFFPDYEVHNVRVKDDFLVNPSYGSQLTLVDASHPSNLIEVANYTTGSGLCWDADPFTNSGNIIATDMDSGMFYVFAPNYVRACYLEGIVSDSTTGLAIQGASVELQPVSVPVASGINGDYLTGYADSGSYNVQVSKNGYVTRLIPVNLTNGIVTTLNVKLLTTAAGINEAGENGIHVFPNPSTDCVYIDSERRISGWRIIDECGKMVIENERESFNEKRIDVSALAHGHYILELYSGGKIISKPLMRN